MSDAALPLRRARPATGLRRFVRRNPTIYLGGGIIAVMLLLALAAPLYRRQSVSDDPMHRLEPPSALYWFGTDNLGRDVFARSLYGARISLLVGFTVGIAAMAGGLLIGLLAGYYRRFDGIVMRLMDGLMAIPNILLAIALVSLTHGGVGIVILAIVIPEVPREVRLVRAVVLERARAALCGGGDAPAARGPRKSCVGTSCPAPSRR